MKRFAPMVSIVIPVYNGSNYLGCAIDSALSQSYPNVEVLVVNDGSADDGKTEAVAASYGEKIRYFSKPNGGVATALNMGVRNMRGEYFSWLSHDDAYHRFKVEAQIRLLERLGERSAIVSCGTTYMDASGRATGRFHPRDAHSRARLARPLYPLMHSLISGCALLIRRTHFERDGLFDEALATTQDYALWFKMMRSRRVYFHPGCLLYTRIHDRQGSRPENADHVAECDRLWIGFMKELDRREMREIGGTEARFFQEMHAHLLRNSRYDAAAAYAKTRMAQALRAEREAGEISVERETRALARAEHTEKWLLRDRELSGRAGGGMERLLISAGTEGLRSGAARVYRAAERRLILSKARSSMR